MAQRDVFRRYLEAGMAFTEMTRSRAEQIVKDLVKAGDIPKKRAEDSIDELLDRSRKNTEVLVQLVQDQVKEQLSALGIATKDDLAQLEARLSSARGAPAGAGAAGATNAGLEVVPPPVGEGGRPAPDPEAARAAKKATKVATKVATKTAPKTAATKATSTTGKATTKAGPAVKKAAATKATKAAKKA